MRLDALFRLGFPSAPDLIALNLATHHNSPAHFPRGTPSLSTRSPPLPAPTACRHTVSGLFHSPSGVLFTFPSRYCSTIGRLRYLALDRGRPGFRRNSTCSALLGFPSQEVPSVSPTGLSPSSTGFPNTVRLQKAFVTPRSRCGRFRIDPSTPTAQRPQA